MAGLNILFPVAQSVTVDGKKVKLKPVQLQHFDLYGKAAAALIQLLNGASVAQINQYAEKHADELREVLKVTTDLGWLARRTLPAATAVQLLVAVVGANSGFFASALPDMVESLNTAISSSD
ncbi:MAG: hypothetical protein CVV07_07395 [Gammaproteobacteria bacterium HGW-Gammaproteobacteria-11]|nr:MAG: hypothetical protein CVV07_07395 [Gammaproteobacteria bacterium HGW-Gammaproteobacteria-11]